MSDVPSRLTEKAQNAQTAFALDDLLRLREAEIERLTAELAEMREWPLNRMVVSLTLERTALRAALVAVKAEIVKHFSNRPENAHTYFGVACKLIDEALHGATVQPPELRVNAPLLRIETSAWETTRNEHEVTCHSRMIGGVLCRWWGDEPTPPGVEVIDRAAVQTSGQPEKP